jgi:hypothetical protein
MYITGIQAFCNKEHWIEYQVQNKDKLVQKGRKIQKAELRKRKEALRPRSWYLKEAQAWFNKFIRLRDAGDACISCGRNSGAKMNAGHYKSVGSTPELRYEEDNCHLQCEHCNSYKSGNIEHYRPNLILKIGLDRVEWLEGPHEAKKYTIDDLKEIIAKYKAKCKELEMRHGSQ